MTIKQVEKTTGLKVKPGSYHQGITQTWRLESEFKGIAPYRLELEYLASEKTFRLWCGGHIVETWPSKTGGES